MLDWRIAKRFEETANEWMHSFGKLSSMIMQKKRSSQVQQLSRQQVTLLSGAQLMKLFSEKEFAPLQLKTTENSYSKNSSNSIVIKNVLKGTKTRFSTGKKNYEKFPKNAKLAEILLCFPGTAVPSERVWSDAGNIVTSARQTPSTLNFGMLLFLRENLK